MHRKCEGSRVGLGQQVRRQTIVAVEHPVALRAVARAVAPGEQAPGGRREAERVRQELEDDE